MKTHDSDKQSKSAKSKNPSDNMSVSEHAEEKKIRIPVEEDKVIEPRVHMLHAPHPCIVTPYGTKVQRKIPHRVPEHNRTQPLCQKFSITATLMSS